MLFNSYGFLVFFPIVVVIYFLLPKKISNLWLQATIFIWGGMQSMHFYFWFQRQLHM